MVNNQDGALIYQFSVLELEATTTLDKVRNQRCEQKELESSARDGESPVCQVSLTLYLPPAIEQAASSDVFVE